MIKIELPRHDVIGSCLLSRRLLIGQKLINTDIVGIYPFQNRFDEKIWIDFTKKLQQILRKAQLSRSGDIGLNCGLEFLGIRLANSHGGDSFGSPSEIAIYTFGNTETSLFIFNDLISV